MATKRLKDDEGNVYEIDIEDEDEDSDDGDDEDTRKDYEWLRARRIEWESSQSSKKKPTVRRVRSPGQKPPAKTSSKRVLRIA
jgi:hypothetical protein